VITTTWGIKDFYGTIFDNGCEVGSFVLEFGENHRMHWLVSIEGTRFEVQRNPNKIIAEQLQEVMYGVA
jgi:hypothetical protein